MALPFSRRELFTSESISVCDFRCHSHVHRCGPEEQNGKDTVVFVRRGVFGRTVRGRAQIADANHVLFFNADEPYAIAHPLPGGDDCTILSLPAQVTRELVGRQAPGDAEREKHLFRRAQALSSRRAVTLHQELMSRLRAGGQSALVLEDLLAELAAEGVRCAYAGATRPRAHRHREAVEEAKVLLNAQLTALPTLGELAARFGYSSFHFSRVFAQTAGLSLRRYLGALRARAAADRIAAGEGERALTTLALELGYGDHAHFTNAFRREWGVPPSVFRQRARPRG